jgi:hypothetical protein
LSSAQFLVEAYQLPFNKTEFPVKKAATIGIKNTMVLSEQELSSVFWFSMNWSLESN